MEVAVLADIHGNYIALERCLEYAFSRDINTFFFLGDYIGELPHPERTMEILYDLNERYQCHFIKGNKEDYWLRYREEGEKGWEFGNSTSGSLLYSYEALTDKDLDFFGQMMPASEIAISESEIITICHGSPYKVNEKMLPDDERTIQIINSVRTSVILCGHTHIQSKMIYGEKKVINPGSVGMPYFSEGKTQFMLLNDNQGNWTEEFISLKYDVDRVIKEMHDVRLYEYAPYWSIITGQVLKGSNVSQGEILSRVVELCRNETGQCIWPDIPERYWGEAVEELLKL